MDRKILWLDLETTGLDPDRHAVVQLAGMVEIDGEVVDRFNYLVQPVKGKLISGKALSKIGRTREELDTFAPPSEVMRAFSEKLQQYVDLYDRQDKFTVAGYNVRFDVDFMFRFFKDHKDQFLFSYIRFPVLDVASVLALAGYRGCVDLSAPENFKLESVCKWLGIPLKKAHDAESDINATKELFDCLLGSSHLSMGPA